MSEIWKPIPEYEGFYEVSNIGRVRSLDRFVPSKKSLSGKRFAPGTVLRPATKNNGYLQISLAREKHRKYISVHRLVAMAFISEIPEGMHVCHNDGDKANNKLSNLRIDTPSGNQLDKLKHGTAILGQNVHTSKLTESQALQIFEMLKAGERTNSIAKRFKVSRQIVNDIKSGKTWKHLDLKLTVDELKVLKKANKRRQLGSSNPKSKLTEGHVREIWKQLEAGRLQKLIAEEFGINQSQVSAIKLRKTWKHLDLEQRHDGQATS